MKLFLVLITVVVMSLAIATCASAAAVFTIDSLPSGSVELSGAMNTEYDLNVTIIACGGLIDRFKLGAEYGIGDFTTPTPTDLDLWSIKAGYRVVDQTATKFDVITALLNISTESGANTSEFDATYLGFDFTQYFSKQAGLAISYVYGINGENVHYALGTDTDVPSTMLRVKFNYMFNDNLGAALGYTRLVYETDLVDFTLGGYSLGLLYRF